LNLQNTKRVAHVPLALASPLSSSLSSAVCQVSLNRCKLLAPRAFLSHTSHLNSIASHLNSIASHILRCLTSHRISSPHIVTPLAASPHRRRLTLGSRATYAAFVPILRTLLLTTVAPSGPIRLQSLRQQQHLQVSCLACIRAVAPKCLTLPQVALPLVHAGPLLPPSPQCFGRLALAVATSAFVSPKPCLKCPAWLAQCADSAPKLLAARRLSHPSLTSSRPHLAPSRPRSLHFYGPSLQVTALAPVASSHPISFAPCSCHFLSSLMKSTYYDCDASAFMLSSFSEIIVRAIANCTEPLAHHSPPPPSSASRCMYTEKRFLLLKKKQPSCSATLLMTRFIQRAVGSTCKRFF